MRLRFGTVVLVGLAAFAGCHRAPATDKLLDDLRSSEESDRIKAVRWLGDRQREGSKVVPALIESLKDVDAGVRRSAAIGLGYFGAEAESAIPPLEKAQNDTDVRVREAAKVAIARIRGEE
jgi:HEAT repeat protein